MQTEGNTQRTLQIDPEFRSLLPILTTEESAALEESIEREGCRDALIVWGDTLVDGHNRHEICTRRGFPFQVRQMEFEGREDVIIWICANQNARRNITPEQKAYLLGKRYEAEKQREGRPQKLAHCGQVSGSNATAQRIATELDIGRNTVRRAGEYARAVDALAEASQTIKHKILAGEINQPRAAIVEIATKPEAERKAAVERMERGDPPELEVKTKECRLCGRMLPLDQFTTQGAGRVASYCRQCSAAVKAANCRVSDMRADLRENMQILSDIADSLHGKNGGVEYTIDNVLNEIRLGGERFANLVRDTYEQPALMGDEKNVEAVNALLEDIVANINNLRRGRLSSGVFSETQNNGGTHEAH